MNFFCPTLCHRLRILHEFAPNKNELKMKEKKLLPIFFSSFKSLNHINLLDFDKTTLVHKSDESLENGFSTSYIQ